MKLVSILFLTALMSITAFAQRPRTMDANRCVEGDTATRAANNESEV